jgi:hypothetical protein
LSFINISGIFDVSYELRTCAFGHVLLVNFIKLLLTICFRVAAPGVALTGAAPLPMALQPCRDTLGGAAPLP